MIYYIVRKEIFLAGPTREIPSEQDCPILPARVANQNAGFSHITNSVSNLSDGRATDITEGIKLTEVLQDKFEIQVDRKLS